MYGTEPSYNEPQSNEILVVTNTILKRERKLYLDITNKCQHVTEREQKMNAKQAIHLPTRIKFMSTVVLSSFVRLFLCF